MLLGGVSCPQIFKRELCYDLVSQVRGRMGSVPVCESETRQFWNRGPSQAEIVKAGNLTVQPPWANSRGIEANTSLRLSPPRIPPISSLMNPAPGQLLQRREALALIHIREELQIVLGQYADLRWLLSSGWPEREYKEPGIHRYQVLSSSVNSSKH